MSKQSKFKRFGLSVKSFTFALIVHVVLFAVIGLNLDWTKSTKVGGQPKVMQAVALNEQDIQSAVDELKKREQRTAQKKLDAQKQLDLLEKKKRNEELRIEQLKEDRLEAEKKKAEADKQKSQAVKAQKLEEARRLETKKQAQREEQDRLVAKKKRQDEDKKRAKAEKKREVVEQQRLAEKKKRQAADEKKKKLAVDKKRKAAKEKAAKEKEIRDKLAKQKADREASLKQQMEAERLERAQQSALSAAFSAIKSAVSRNFGTRPNWVGLKVSFDMRMTANGDVLSLALTRSSGNRLLDEEAERAIRKASPLPVRLPGKGPFTIPFDFEPE